MDSATFEEVAVSEKVIGDVYKWITEGTEVNLVSFKGNVIEVIPPSPAVFTVVETEPSFKGNTQAQGYTKPAKLDCGATISVPGFIDAGQVIRVDTEKGIYMERVN
jgi:elongation factor P